MPDEVVKPQPTLTGYTAWVVARLVDAKREKPAKIAAWVIERWVDENEDFLAKLGIRREDFIRAVAPVGDRESGGKAAG